MFPLCQDNKEVLDAKKQLEKQKSDASKRGTPTQNYGCIICESHKLRTASNHSTKDCKFLSEYKASNRPHYHPDKANSRYFCHIHGWGNHGTKVCRSLPDIIPQQTPPPRTNENPRGNRYQSHDRYQRDWDNNCDREWYPDQACGRYRDQPRSCDYEDRRPNDYERNRRNEYPRNSYPRQNDDPGPPPNPRRMYYQGYQPYQEPERDLPRYLTEEDVNKKLEEYMKNHPKN